MEREVFSSGDDGVERWERRCLGCWLKIFAAFSLDGSLMIDCRLSWIVWFAGC